MLGLTIGRLLVCFLSHTKHMTSKAIFNTNNTVKILFVYYMDEDIDFWNAENIAGQVMYNSSA